MHLTAYYFRNKSSIIDIQLGYIQVLENIEMFKVKLRWSKSLRLLQRVAFVMFCNQILYGSSELTTFIDKCLLYFEIFNFATILEKKLLKSQKFLCCQ